MFLGSYLFILLYGMWATSYYYLHLYISFFMPRLAQVAWSVSSFVSLGLLKPLLQSIQELLKLPVHKWFTWWTSACMLANWLVYLDYINLLCNWNIYPTLTCFSRSGVCVVLLDGIQHVQLKLCLYLVSWSSFFYNISILLGYSFLTWDILQALSRNPSMCLMKKLKLAFN